MKSKTDVTLAKCPTCSCMMNVARAVSFANEKVGVGVGDILMCCECGDVLEVTPGLGLRMPDLSTLLKLTPQQHAAMDVAQQKIREMRGQTK